MSFAKKDYNLSDENNRQIQKIIDTLKMGGRSEKTIKNYVCAISRYLQFFKNVDISKLDEDDIIDYIKHNYLRKKCATNTYNMNINAIKYFYSIIYKKELNNKLLPYSKRIKRLPETIDKETFIKIFNCEKSLKHKCWLLLGYCSGLRADEITKIKLTDINAEEHKLKVFGKRNKERLTVLPDITIKYLRLYYKSYYFKEYNKRINQTGYLFEGYRYQYLSSKTITNYFTTIKNKHNLGKNITFHSLRHSFATNFIKAGGDPFTLKSMLGHSTINTTAIYVHMGRDFNNIKGVNYDGI